METFSDFSDRAGERFELEAGEERHALTLESATRLGGTHREGGSFRLMFRGPADPVLPQATYRIRGDRSEHFMFLVPIGRDESGTEYEAVFN